MSVRAFDPTGLRQIKAAVENMHGQFKRIEQAHQPTELGTCRECSWEWPCATNLWATITMAPGADWAPGRS